MVTFEGDCFLRPKALFVECVIVGLGYQFY